MVKENFNPKILAFLCKWCSSAGADLAGTSRIKYPPNVLPITVMCSSRIDPSFIIHAFKRGADGVLVAGCHPGDCHYQTGNYKTRRRIYLLKELLEDLGIESGRLRLEWISAAEGLKFASVIKEFTREIQTLGPLNRGNG